MKDILDEPIREEKVTESDLKAAVKLFAIALAMLGGGSILFMMIYFFGIDSYLMMVILFVLFFGFFGYLFLAIFYGIKGIIFKIW